MSPLALSCVIFLLVLGGIFIGAAFRRALPENHLSRETQDVVRLGAGLTATIAALERTWPIAVQMSLFTRSGHLLRYRNLFSN